MHLLPCPHCDAKLSVAPSQAGDNMPCPECGQSVAIPSLGQIRQLPQAEQEASSTQSSGSATQSDVSAIRRAGFLLFGLIAIGSLMIAAYSGIRWYLIDVPATTEEHIAMIREEYAEAPAAQLIREFEDMEVEAPQKRQSRHVDARPRLIVGEWLEGQQERPRMQPRGDSRARRC